RLVLPGYPFERQRHWLAGSEIEAKVASSEPEDCVSILPVDAQPNLQERIERLLRHGIGALRGIPVDQVSAQRSFQDHGIDSIAAAGLRRDVGRKLGIRVSARHMLNHPTPASLASFAAKPEAGRVAASRNTLPVTGERP